jgi:hypothetical protein
LEERVNETCKVYIGENIKNEKAKLLQSKAEIRIPQYLKIV